MKRLKRLIVIILLFSTSLWFSCTKKEEPKTKPIIVKDILKTVYVVNYPLKYFADRIANGKVEVVFPAPAKGHPAFWMPDSKTIKMYQDSNLILLNGATFAKWVDKVTLPESKVVNTSISFKDRYLMLEHAITHSHGPGGKHAHVGTDFTTWMDPNQAIIQAREVKDALVDLVPSESILFENNFKDLEKDLLVLNQTFKSIISGKENIPLIASHPFYGYFAKAYNLRLKALHWKPYKIPDEEEWKKLDEILTEHTAKWMIWHRIPIEENVTKLKEHGLDSIVFNPCGNVPETGDYLQVMKHNAENLKKIFN